MSTNRPCWLRPPARSGWLSSLYKVFPRPCAVASSRCCWRHWRWRRVWPGCARQPAPCSARTGGEPSLLPPGRGGTITNTFVITPLLYLGFINTLEQQRLTFASTSAPCSQSSRRQCSACCLSALALLSSTLAPVLRVRTLGQLIINECMAVWPRWFLEVSYGSDRKTLCRKSLPLDSELTQTDQMTLSYSFLFVYYARCLSMTWSDCLLTILVFVSQTLWVYVNTESPRHVCLLEENKVYSDSDHIHIFMSLLTGCEGLHLRTAGSANSEHLC